MTKRTLLLSACVFTLASALAETSAAGEWRMFGRTLQNLANSSSEQTITKDNAPRLSPKWVATTGGDVSARAAIVDGVAYLPDWGGNLWALDVRSGKPVWHKKLQEYGLPAGTVSRTSPAVEGDTLLLGTQQGGYLLAVNKNTGALKWLSQMDSHPLAIITSSPAVSNGIIYIGVASLEEAASGNPSYPCCSFRGSVVAADARTGQIIWKTFTVPTGYTGGSVWGSNPAVDAQRHEIFVGTGNNYSTPTDPAYVACIAAGGTARSCVSPDDHFDSLLALDMGNGRIKWSRRLASSDDWNVACFAEPSGTGNCPTGSGPDYDFGSGLQEFTIKLSDGRTRTLLGAGQKSGVYSAFDVDTRKLLWARQVGPGSTLGGIEWGSASDGKRIYVAISNFNGIRYAAGQAGSWNALDAATGDILWRTPDPDGSIDLGPLAVANGVVYAPSMGSGAGQANMFALDAATGTVSWSYVSGASVIAGASIVDGVVYWGSGYTNLGIPGFTGNTKFYAFSLGGK